jgi:hypothetical protein
MKVMRMKPGLRALGILLVLGARTLSACAAVATPVFTKDQLREDFAALERILEDMPPDLAFTTDLAALATEKRRIIAQLESVEALTRDQAWQLFATLNPVLRDGHLVVGIPDWREATRAHLAAGGSLFPYEVHVSPKGEITILSALGGSADANSGKRIRKINGRNASAVFQELMARVPGDTPTFRAGILSARFWLYYWKVFGAPDHFDIQFAGRRHTERVAAARIVPATLAHEDVFESLFRFQALPGDAAVLTVGSFVWDDKPRYLTFMQSAFRQMKENGTKTLIIDIRDNTGGNDDLWREGILAYIATQKYRWASWYRKRVATPDPAKNEKVGDIVEGELETWIPPEPDNPLRFDGKVYVLLGPSTYSSSVLFCVVMQDFGFGTLVAEGARASVRATQTGGTRGTKLPNTGINIITPRFVLTRPSGSRSPLFLEADHQLTADPLDRSAAIRRALAIARKAH